ncbi:DNA repair protein RAD50-like isoform X2 [Lineus longissimus]
MAAEREVKGQTRLIFRDVTGNKCMVVRSLMVTQEANNRLKMKTLDSSLARRGDDGQMKTLTSRCGDMNREMVAALGVSKAVLENVIFCHQEESNWPLLEGKAVKQRFDDIFASTRYVKALENIIKIKKEEGGNIREFQAEIKYLKANKEKEATLKRDLDDAESRFQAANHSLQEIKNRLAPVEGKLDEINKNAANIHKLKTQIEKLSSEKKEMERTTAMFREKITVEFDGSLDELKEELQEFKKKIKERQGQLRKIESKLDGFSHDLSKHNQRRSQLLTEQGKLQHEAKVQGDNCQRRNATINKYAQEYEFEGFTDVSDQHVPKFMELLKGRIDESLREAKRLRDLYEEKEAEVQSRIDSVRETKTKFVQTEAMRVDMVKKNKAEVKSLTQELNRVDASAGKLDSLNRDLSRTEHDLTAAERAVDIDVLKTEVSQLQKERVTLDRQAKEIDSEMSRMHLESTLRTELDMLKKEKGSKEDQIRKIKGRHEDTFQHLFGHVPSTNVRRTLEDYIQKLNQEIHKENSKLQQDRQQISRKEGQYKIYKEELTKKEQDLKEHEESMFEMCGSQDFDEGVAGLQDRLKKIQDDKGSVQGAKHFFDKYVKQLQKDDPTCPLCQRGFDEHAEVEELVHSLQGRLRLAPRELEKKEQELRDTTMKYEKMIQMKPVLEVMDRLSKKEIPDLKNSLKKLGSEIDKLKKDTSEMDDFIQLKQDDESMAKELQPDVVTMDRFQGELRDLDRKIAQQSTKLSGEDNDRTMQQVANEKEEVSLKLNTVNNNLDQKRDKISRQTELIQTLKSEVNSFMAEKLQIENDLQKCIKLKETKAELISSNQQYEREIEEAREQIQPLEDKILQLRKEREDIVSKKDTKIDETKADMSRMKEHGNEVRQIHREITKYMNEGRDTALAQCQEQMKELDAMMDDMRREQSRYSDNLNQLKEELVNQQVKERELSDNLEMREKEEEIKEVNKRIDHLGKKIGDFDVSNLERQRRQLMEEQDDLNAEKHTVVERQRSLKDDIKRITRELNTDYKDAEVKYRDKMIALKTTELAMKDLDKYYKALDKAVMRYHKNKMEEINKIIKEIWRNTYRGNDIDTIEIRSDEDEAGLSKGRRTYHYRVVMVKMDTVMDMRGRCSAGQKVLACLIIRLALAETFCLKCGILALDEPTTNLDRENICSLAYALTEIIKSRAGHRNFQLVVITHDEDFVELLGGSDYVEYFFKIGRDVQGHSMITRTPVNGLRT